MDVYFCLRLTKKAPSPPPNKFLLERNNKYDNISGINK